MFLIKFLFITIIILWVIRLLVRLIFPVMLRNAFGNMQQQAANAGQQQRSSKPEGAITIDHMPKKEKKGNADKLGDFVEYEEIK
ncbi:MAG: DUF4834 family protein [Bacteroidia bacterium]